MFKVNNHVILLFLLLTFIVTLPRARIPCDIQGTIECGFTMKRVRDIMRTYSCLRVAEKFQQVCKLLESFMKLVGDGAFF